MVDIREMAIQGPEVFLVNGLRQNRRRSVEQSRPVQLLDPTRALSHRGQEEIGIELAEQLSWELPEVIFYPTGAVTSLVCGTSSLNSKHSAGSGQNGRAWQ